MGKFNVRQALATGVSVPADAGFGQTVIVAHKCAVSFFSVGNLASAGVRALAEDGLYLLTSKQKSLRPLRLETAQALVDDPCSKTLPTGNTNGPNSLPVKEEFSCLTILRQDQSDLGLVRRRQRTRSAKRRDLAHTRKQQQHLR